MTTRIIVTGSRRWTNRTAIREALAKTAQTYGTITVVHGAASGADRHASEWAQNWIQYGIQERPYPADWKHCAPDCPPGHRLTGRHGEYCPTAGTRRNLQMIADGAALVLAFPIGRSPGTRHCIRHAEAAGIPVDRLEG